MIVAIFVRCAFEELVRIENSTWSPCGSTQSAVTLPGKARGLQELRGRAPSERAGCGIFLVEPQFISRRYLIPDRRGAPAINQAHDSFAINCRRNGLPEAQILKPGLFPGDFRQNLSHQIVQIEEQEIVFEARAQIVEMITLLRLLFLQHREIVRAEAAEHVRIAGLKADYLRVLAGNKQKHDFVEIGQLGPGAICLPIIWIALQHHALPGDVFLQAKWAEAGELVRRHGKGPRLRKVAGAVAALQQMARQNRNAVEQPFRGRIGLRQFKADGVVVYFYDGDGFSADNEQIPLRRIHFFVEINLKTEDHVVRVEWFAIGETDAAAKLQRVLPAVARDAPGFCERRFGF